VKVAPTLLTCALLWSGQFSQPANPLQRAIEEIRVELCQDYGGAMVVISRRLLLETQTDGEHVSAIGTGAWQPLKRVRLQVEAGAEVPP